MIDYLTQHPRYHTMNSWNGSTSYAHNVKLYRMNLPTSVKDAVYDVIQTDEFWSNVHSLLEEFAVQHQFLWQAGFNGRSGGYLVLYQGGRDATGHVFTYPGKAVDRTEDFSEWDDGALEERVGVVKSFDALRDEIESLLVDTCLNYDAVDVTVLVPKKEKMLVPK